MGATDLPTTVKSAKSKRDDIQGLRGFSILAVILFHLFPRWFPRGFLGVDVFFVISGYLIARILSKEKTISTKCLVHFYKQRFSRIVPSYAILLVITLLAATFRFAGTDLQAVIISTKWSAVFARNIEQIIEAKDYWSQASEFSPLLHTWSLAVEIQFYFIAPFLYFFINWISPKRYQPLSSFLAFGGFHVVYLISDSTTQFYSLQCRLWQFLLGFIAAHFASEVKQDRLDSENLLTSHGKSYELHSCNRPTLVLFLCIVLLSFLIFDIPVFVGIARLIVSILTCVLLFVGLTEHTALLENKAIVFIGNYSYELYIIHWPAIVLFQYGLRNTHIASLTDVVLISFVFAVLSSLHSSWNHRGAFEKNLLFVGVLYSILALLLYTAPAINEFLQAQISAHTTKADVSVHFRNYSVEERNAALQWALNTDIYPLPPSEQDSEADEWTHYTEPKHTGYSGLFKGKGNLSILLLGNSFAWRAVPIIHKAFEDKFSKLRLYTELGCPILTWQTNCSNFRSAFMVVLEKMQPDIIWVIAWEPTFFVNPITEVEEQVKTTVGILKKHTKYLIIDGQSDYRGFPFDPKQEIIRRLQLGVASFDDMQLSLEKHAEIHKDEFRIMRSVTSNRVIFNNVADQFCEPDFCPFINPLNLHQYYGDLSGHMNQEGLDRLRPGYYSIAKNITGNFKL